MTVVGQGLAFVTPSDPSGTGNQEGLGYHV